MYSTVHKKLSKSGGKLKKSSKRKISVEAEESLVSIDDSKVSPNWVFRWSRIANFCDFAPDIWLQRWVKGWIISHGG